MCSSDLVVGFRKTGFRIPGLCGVREILGVIVRCVSKTHQSYLESKLALIKFMCDNMQNLAHSTTKLENTIVKNIILIYFTTDVRNLFTTSISIVKADSPTDRMRESEL